MNQLQLRSRLHKLQRSLGDYSAGNRELLFAARDSIRDASTDVRSGAWKSLEPVLRSVESLIDEVLRHGNLSEEMAIDLGAKLTAFVTDALAAPAPSVQVNAPGAGGAKLELPTLPTTLPIVKHRETPLSLNEASVQPAPPTLEGPPSLAGSAHEKKPAVDPAGEPEGLARRGASVGKISLDLVNESRLGVILVRTGRITPEDLERALALQKVQPDRLGAVLASMGIVTESELVEALEDQRNATLELADGIAGAESPEPDAEPPSSHYDDLSTAS